MPYVAIHEPRIARLPRDFKVSDYPGLLFCHTASEGGIERLFSYWKSQESYDLYGGAFTAVHTLSSTSSGRFTDFRQKSEPFWRNASVWTTLVAVFTLFGLSAALWEQVARVFEGPVVYINASAENPPDVLADTSCRAPRRVIVKNSTCGSRCHVRR